MPEGGGGSGTPMNQQIASALGITPAQASALIQKAINQGHSPSDPGFVATVIKMAQGGGGGGNNDDGVIVPIDGGTGGGSGGGSGGSGATGPDPAVLRSAYLAVIRSWGLDPGKLKALIDRAVAGEMTTLQFQQAVRQTKAYKINFHGINSQPGMTEASYLAQYRQFKALAQDIGRGLDRREFGTLLKKGVDFKEWQFRVQGLELAEKNAPVMEWWRRQLVRRGELKPQDKLTLKRQWEITTKQNSVQFERDFERAWLMGNLQRFGYDLRGKDKDIDRKRILSLIKQFEGGTRGAEVEALGAQDFAELAEQAKLLPASRLYGFGVSKGDLLEMKLGGRNAGRIAARVQNAVNMAKAATEEKAGAQLVQTEKGTKLLSGGLSSE